MSSQVAACLPAEPEQVDHEVDSRVSATFLPPETLSQIFQYACTLPDDIDGDDPHFPVVLGGVSRHWREVAWSTPSLWTTLAVRTKHPQYASANNLSLLRLYLKNAEIHLLSIRIYVPKKPRDRAEDIALDANCVAVWEIFDLLFSKRVKIPEETSLPKYVASMVVHQV